MTQMIGGSVFFAETAKDHAQAGAVSMGGDGIEPPANSV